MRFSISIILRIKTIVLERLAKCIKYGTEDSTEIWMLRYGFFFEEIEWLKPCVESIDQTEIKFNEKLKTSAMLRK